MEVLNCHVVSTDAHSEWITRSLPVEAGVPLGLGSWSRGPADDGMGTLEDNWALRDRRCPCCTAVQAGPMHKDRDSNCSEAGEACFKTSRRSEDAWLHDMLRSAFFTPCERHSDLKKHEVTHYCIDCCSRSCTHCLADHTGHRLLQVRRYVYTNVVRASDMSPLLDISGVQTYIINQAKVMFLNQRPQSKMSRPGAPDACATCSRTLREGCSYCSLACKVDALVTAGKLILPAKDGLAATAGPGGPADAAAGTAAGSASDSSDCWGVSCKDQCCDTQGSGDSSSSHQLHACSWGHAAQQFQLMGCCATAEQHQQHKHVGAQAEWLRRHSDSDSDGRCSSGSYCSRRKQGSPRRSPLL